MNIEKDANIAAVCIDEGGEDQGSCSLTMPRGCVAFEPNPVACLAVTGEGS